MNINCYLVAALLLAFADCCSAGAVVAEAPKRVRIEYENGLLLVVSSGADGLIDRFELFVEGGKKEVPPAELRDLRWAVLTSAVLVRVKNDKGVEEGFNIYFQLEDQVYDWGLDRKKVTLEFRGDCVRRLVSYPTGKDLAVIRFKDAGKDERDGAVPSDQTDEK